MNNYSSTVHINKRGKISRIRGKTNLLHPGNLKPVYAKRINRSCLNHILSICDRYVVDICRSLNISCALLILWF